MFFSSPAPLASPLRGDFNALGGSIDHHTFSFSVCQGSFWDFLSQELLGVSITVPVVAAYVAVLAVKAKSGEVKYPSGLASGAFWSF